MSENKDLDKSMEGEDPDSYIRTIASTWGHTDLVGEWLPHHRDNPSKITDNVLIPAAMYGQLEVLKLGLEFGDVTKSDDSPEYPGWSLMHFAVEGAQRNLPLFVAEKDNNNLHPTIENTQSIPITNSMTPPTPRSLTPRSVHDIHATQLDIIYELAKAGADPTAVDNEGFSASYRACKQLETSFLEGALLLDILAMMKVRGEEVSIEGTNELHTPGLSSIPSAPGWRENMKHLVEWAYFRGHYEILKFCQLNKCINLTSPKLLIKSNANTLRQCEKPLIIDAIHQENFKMIKVILNLSNTPTNALSSMCEYDHDQSRKKESVLLYACTKYLDGQTNILANLFRLDSENKFLTHITLSGVGLRRLPFTIMHENLITLDVRENNLDVFPTNSPDVLKLGWKCQNLQTLNCSNNLFISIHPDIFHLPNLKRLVMSNNKIQELPMDMWTAPFLQFLELSNNLIAEVPCPQPIARSDQMSMFSSLPSVGPRLRRRVMSDSENYLQSLKRTYVSYNVRSSEDIQRSQVGFLLHLLDLSGNRLSNIPSGLPCLAPLLHTLKLARNVIINLGHFSDYPPLLQSLDLSNNGITRGISPSTSNTPNIKCIQSQLAIGQSYCTHYMHTNLNCIKFLYLCNNRIDDLQIESQKEEDFELSQASTDEGVTGLSPEPELLYPKLQILKISNNSLERFPENIHRLSNIRELVVSGNPRIREIPPMIHKLTSLFTFRYEGISDPIVQELAHFKMTSEVLYYLKARALKCCSNTSMRLFMIGHYAKGKTTLLRCLRGHSATSTFDSRTKRIGCDPDALSPDVKESTVGIECGKWVCTPSKRTPGINATPITFYTWDFAGQEEYYVTHQCFLTNRALYILVWNVLDGDAGVQSLSVWLQNLQAKARGSSHTVIVVGTHIDKIPRKEWQHKFRIWIDKLEKYRIGQNQSRGFPKISAIHFVGCPPRSRNVTNIDSLKDLIYNTACNMQSPGAFGDSRDWESLIGFKVKILEEKIPQSYDNLRQYIERLPTGRTAGTNSPVIHKKDFCQRVSDIIESETEVETAVDYLHATTGIILHFNIPVIKDFYITDPQRWFDLCALVISPDNVSSLVRIGRPGDEKFGLLSSSKMTDEFLQQGCNDNVSRLIRHFLSQLSIIHQVNREYCLVPSAINPDPALHHKELLGSFPRQQRYQFEQHSLDTLDQLPSIEALVCNVSAGGSLEVKKSGLIFRRMLLLPPIASGFWSKLIALCLQKQDFQQIVLKAIPSEYSMQPSGPAHRLRSIIGNLELSWMYWKTGIILYISEIAILEVHSLRSHEFEDPQEKNDKAASIFQSRIKKLKMFCYEGSDGWSFIPPHFKEVIEVIVPEIFIVNRETVINPNVLPPVSSMILVKALEIIDEVLKSHCEQFAITGIYSLNDMIHVIPCPLCYGDNDERQHEPPERQRLGNLYDSIDDSFNDFHKSITQDQVQFPQDCICVFTIDNCIRKTFTYDVIVCPKCGPLEIEFLAPDLIFSDVSNFKLDKEQLSHPVNREEVPIAKGSFGIVYRRTLHTANEGDLDVAVKLFDQIENSLPQSQVEVTRSYSDMRYELNKLGFLNHPNIVRFIGVIINPHCFVLEWAPLLSLEYQRSEHNKARSNMCLTSILYVLMQVTSALSYLHSPRDVGIVHRDLKCSNILVFKFPPVGHTCFNHGKQDDCSVLVKITDMGICANPLATKAKASGGLRILVPESVAEDSYCRLTEKVDIYSLGSCLYEMMTLRPLPPDTIAVAQYIQMLLSGKRPQFYASDVAYPPLLFQFLEDCWQQEHYLRPSAEHLYNALKEATSINICPTQGESSREEDSIIGRSVLLDSFTLHQDNRITTSHCNNFRGGLDICTALCGPDGRTAIVNLQYDNECERSELQINPIGIVKNTEVISLQVTPESEIFVGCSDGTIFFYDANRTKTYLKLDHKCQVHHGSIIKVHYCCISELMVVAFDSGKVHIRKCTQGLSSSSTWRESCSSLSNEESEVLDVECLLLNKESDCPVFELWFGIDSNQVEIWSMPMSTDQMWTSETLSKICAISHITMCSSIKEGVEVQVRQIKTSSDQTMMAVVVHVGGQTNLEIFIISIASRQCLRTFKFNHSVSTLLLTPAIFALGSYEGAVYVYNTPGLIDSQLTTITTEHKILHAHFHRVYTLHHLQGNIGTDGSTSLFPTFIGRVTEEVERNFLISIGFGRGYPSLKKHKLFKKSSHKRGCYVNVWLL